MRKLRVLMALKGLTTAALATLVGYRASELSNVFRGHRKSWPVMRRVNKVFGQKIFSRPRRIRRPRKPIPHKT